jgi:hypothetical protein
MQSFEKGTSSHHLRSGDTAPGWWPKQSQAADPREASSVKKKPTLSGVFVGDEKSWQFPLSIADCGLRNAE